VTSARQWVANRENAQKSIGPRTDEGYERRALSRQARAFRLFVPHLAASPLLEHSQTQNSTVISR